MKKNNDDILLRINELMRFYSLNKTQFSNKIGVHQSNLSKIFNGERSIGDGTINKIVLAFDINKNWLLTGEGDMLKAGDSKPAPEISYTDGVPYFDVDFKLGFDEMENPGTTNPEYLIKMPGYEKATMWCNVTGRSMEPEISNGDIIALERIEDFSFLPFGDVYGIITVNGMRTIKRLGRGASEGSYRLIPTNKEYDEQEIPVTAIAAVYRVMGTMKRL